jgi:predicted component of type VI protein secretion system
MKARVIKTATLTLQPGQIVELDEKQFATAEKLGLVAAEEKETKKKRAAK